MYVGFALMALSESELLELIPRAFLFGVVLGVVYDVLRAFRRVFKYGALRIALEDIAYFSCYGAVIFYNLMNYGKGMVILSVIASFVVGSLIYILLISKILLNLFVYILGFVVGVVKFILFPMVKLFDFFSKKVLQPVMLLLYNKTTSVGRFVKRGVCDLTGVFKVKKNRKNATIRKNSIHPKGHSTHKAN